MLALPAAVLDSLRLGPGAVVDLTVDNGRLLIAPKTRPHYMLADLLAASDYSAPNLTEDREWADASAVGREPLIQY